MKPIPEPSIYLSPLQKIILLFSKDALNSFKRIRQRMKKIKEYNITFATKILSSTTVLKIDDNLKCFLSSKSSC